MSSKKLFFGEAIARAVGEEMERQEKLVILGQDVGRFGGAYKEFAGLFERFGPARVRDTPVAEAATIGLGIGAAAAGLRALVSITYMDFLLLGLDALVNYAAKARYKTGGKIRVPVVVKTTAGAKGQGVAHAQCIESWLMGVPGLKVVAPSHAADAYGLLKASLQEEGPVLFVDHKRLFPTASDVPTASEPAMLGKAAIVRRGRDVTLAAHSYMTRIGDEAAARLASRGISCEVVDLRTLAPLDEDTLCESAAQTRALVTLEEGQAVCGVGTEVAFRVRERVEGVRIARVAALPAPVSSNPVLESATLPDAARVVETVERLLAQ